MSVYRPDHEQWHDELPGECDCDSSCRDRDLVDDRCEWHRLIEAIDTLTDAGWWVKPPSFRFTQIG